jgi:hypothetical protein
MKCFGQSISTTVFGNIRLPAICSFSAMATGVSFVEDLITSGSFKYSGVDLFQNLLAYGF